MKSEKCFLKKNDLEVVGKPTIFGDDKENKKKQFISYVLKKAENVKEIKQSK